jgi:cephalosporin hydroxylase
MIEKHPSSRAKAAAVKARFDMPVDAFAAGRAAAKKTGIVSNKMRYFGRPTGKSPPDVII